MRMLIVEDDPSMGALLTQLIKRLWPQSSVVLETAALLALEQWKDAGADLVRLGLAENAAERYRVHEVALDGWSA